MKAPVSCILFARILFWWGASWFAAFWLASSAVVWSELGFIWVMFHVSCNVWRASCEVGLSITSPSALRFRPGFSRLQLYNHLRLGQTEACGEIFCHVCPACGPTRMSRISPDQCSNSAMSSSTDSDVQTWMVRGKLPLARGQVNGWAGPWIWGSRRIPLSSWKHDQADALSSTYREMSLRHFGVTETVEQQSLQLQNWQERLLWQLQRAVLVKVLHFPFETMWQQPFPWLMLLVSSRSSELAHLEMILGP